MYWRRAAMVALAVPIMFVATGPLLAKARASRADAANELQRVLDDVRLRLGVDHAVVVELVSANPYLVSVSTPKERGGAFVVQVEEGMIGLLSEEELEAALAHELGHVWVFTHHPYLQTELLANQIAMRVVGRDSLVRVYEKVWARDGRKGNLVRFLGQ